MVETMQIDYVGGFEVNTSYLGDDPLVMGLDRVLSELVPLVGVGANPGEEAGLYEGMVFQGEVGADVYVARYKTREAAVDGHHRVVARIRADDFP